MILILILFTLFLIGIPIGFSLGLVSMAELFSMGIPMQVAVQKLFGGIDSIPLTAVLLFTLAGELMMFGGISKRLIKFADTLVGHLPSGMAMVSILGCMFFAALTGSAIAATAAIGSIMIPIMIERNYDKGFSASIVATAGSIGPIIPPSIPLLIYGVIANASVAKLFIGGIIPGIMMGISLMVISFIIGKKRNYIGSEKRASLKEIKSAGITAIWALFTPLIILGGILTGIFTATESAAVACAYAIIIGMLVYRELTFKDLVKSLWNSAKGTGLVLVIVGFATLFTWVITVQQLPQTLVSLIGSNISNPIVFLLIVNVILLIAGTFIDTTSAIVIFSPLFIPLAVSFGIDLIHFGVMIAVNLTIGMCTPPLGVDLFVASNIAKISLKEMFNDLKPQLLALIIVLLIITYIPATVTWLPSIMIK